jgi:nucleoside-diphosphate-sugar epimerase
MKIAIFGGSGHIGKNIIYYLKDETDTEVYCFSRNPEKAAGFIKLINAKNCIPKTYSEFSGIKFHAIINCIGIGNPANLRKAQDEIFMLTEYYDNLILDHLKKNESTVYINLSSGAVYGTDFSKPANDSSISSIEIDNIATGDYYRIAKINSEAKHRSLSGLNIIDLRIFGFFSRFIELEKEFLLCEIINCIKDNKMFITGADNIFRDYIHPHDFIKIVRRCIAGNNLNKAFDINSKTPVSKFELLDFFKNKYSLNFRVDSNTEFASITGNKLNYYSTSSNFEILKFIPEYTSLESVSTETEALFKSIQL